MFSKYLVNQRNTVRLFLQFLIAIVLLTSAVIPDLVHAQQADPGCSKGGKLVSRNVTTGGGVRAVQYCELPDGSTYNPTTGVPITNANQACAGLAGFLTQPITCLGRTLSVFIGTALVTATAWLLAAVGYLFNLLIDHTVLQFGSTLLTGGTRQAIEVGWTALRDLANIVIIAMFVFIAINIILGVKEFGEKRLIARVLIIAVLINFSLLFSKAIIDASNFTAYQFVKASGFVTDTRDAQGTFEREFVKKGVAGEFIKFMGLASIGETYKALSNAAFGSEGKQYQNASGLYALIHGLVSASLLLAASAVLLYGCYLLITRAVLLIFLMMTSALAFASWLIPQRTVVQGFAQWWEALLKAALFAPLLMIFLWASLNVARALPRKGTLGSMISDPSQTLSLEAVWSYLIVIGLLYVSIYAANRFARGIAGFGAAAMGLGSAARLAGIAGLGTVGLASRFGIAPAWRRTGGRYFARSAMQIEDEIDQRKLTASTPQDWKDIAKLARAKERRNWLAGADLNVMKTGPMKQLAKGLGVGFLAGGHEGGAAETIRKRADLAAKHAAEMTLTAEERANVKKSADERAAKERERERAKHSGDVDSAKGQVGAAKGKVDQREAATAEKRFEDAKASKAAKAKAHDDEIARLQKELAEERDVARSTLLRNRLEGMRGHRDSELRAEDENIQKAKAEVDQIQKPIRDAEAALEAATDRLKNFDRESRGWVDNRAKDIHDEQTRVITEGIHGVGYRLARKTPVTLQSTTLRTGSEQGNLVAEKARRLTKSKVRLKGAAARRRAEREELGAAGLEEEAGGTQGAKT